MTDQIQTAPTAPAKTDLRSADAAEQLTALTTICGDLRDLGAQMPAKPERPRGRLTLTELAEYREAREPLHAWKAQMAERGAAARELAERLQLPLGIEIEAQDAAGQRVLVYGERGRTPADNRWRVIDWYERTDPALDPDDF